MNRISNKELARVLADKFGLTKTASEEFVGLIFDVVNDGLKDDSQSKVKGLGTFKITSVAPRKSVDVNTGDPIIIEGRDKINFTADTALRNQVNRPFAQFETVVLNDDVDFDDIDRKYAESMNETDREEEVDEEVNEDETPEVEPESQTTKEEAEAKPQPETDTAELEEKKDDVTEAEEQPLIVSPDRLALLNGDETREREQTDMKVTSSQDSTARIEQPSFKNNNVLAISAAQLSALNDDVQPEAPIEEDASNDNNENSEMALIKSHATELREEMERQHRHIKVLIAVGALLLLVCVGGIVYMASQLHKRNNRIEHLEALNDIEKTGEEMPVVPQPVATEQVSKQELADSTATVPVAAIDASQQNETEEPAEQKAEQKQSTAKERSATQAKQMDEAPKKTVAKQTEAVEKSAGSKTAAEQQAKYNSDVRIRTGAYTIVGIDHTVTVRKGQTLFSISKAYLGPGMECYVEAVNDGRTEFKAGEKIKIPKLKLKKK